MYEDMKDMGKKWGMMFSSFTKQKELDALMSRGNVPAHTEKRIASTTISPGNTPYVRELEDFDSEPGFADFSLCLVEKGDLAKCVKVIGRAASNIKTNAFTSFCLLETDMIDPLEPFDELGKAWYTACSCIKNNMQEVNVATPFACAKSITVGSSKKFSRVQIHAGSWNINSGCDQGNLRIKRTTFSIENNLISEEVTVTMKKDDDSPVRVLTAYACIVGVEDANEILARHAINKNLQKDVKAGSFIISNFVLGFHHPILTYESMKKTCDWNQQCPLESGVETLAGLKLGCGFGTEEAPFKAQALKVFEKEMKNINNTFVIENNRFMKAALYSSKNNDFMVISSLSCLALIDESFTCWKTG